MNIEQLLENRKKFINQRDEAAKNLSNTVNQIMKLKYPNLGVMTYKNFSKMFLMSSSFDIIEPQEGANTHFDSKDTKFIEEMISKHKKQCIKVEFGAKTKIFSYFITRWV